MFSYPILDFSQVLEKFGPKNHTCLCFYHAVWHFHDLHGIKNRF